MKNINVMNNENINENNENNVIIILMKIIMKIISIWNNESS